MQQRFWKQGLKLRCHRCSHSLILKDLRLLCPDKIFPLAVALPSLPSFLFLYPPQRQLCEERACGSCKHSPPPRLSPLMYWPALARWDGPLAAWQRHVTLEGQCAAIPHPYCSSVRFMQRNLWPHILPSTPHNFPSPLCWSIKVGCAWAWVAGAAFLTFHFSRSDLVTFGPRASVHFAPNCRASYNAKHVESF